MNCAKAVSSFHRVFAPASGSLSRSAAGFWSFVCAGVVVVECEENNGGRGSASQNLPQTRVSRRAHVLCLTVCAHHLAPVSGGGLAFCDFDIAIAKSIFLCPHDSTHTNRGRHVSACACICVFHI